MITRRIQIKAMSSRLFSNQDLAVLFFPLVIEQTLKYSLGLADSMMIASVGEAAISGVSLIDFVLSFITSLFAALLVGGSAVISQYIGAQETVQANKAANQLVLIVGLFSLFLCVAVYAAKSFILNYLFGQLAPDVYAHAEIYLTITASSLPFLALYSAGANLFRCMDNTRLPMKIMTVCNLLNIAGNAILIFCMGMETVGVALPTLFSRIVAAGWILGLLLNKKRKLYLFRQLRLSFDWLIIRRILGIGIPHGIENGMFFLGRILVLGMITSLGTAAIASNAVAGILSNFQVIPGMAVAFGTTVVIARCAGADDYEQVKYYNRKILGIVYVSQFVTSMTVLMLLPQIMRIYGLPAEIIRLTEQIMWIHTLFMIVLWPLSYILPATFRATGDARYPMAVSIIGLFAGRIFGSWLFGIHWQMGVLGVWLGMFADWIIKSACFIVRYYSGKWIRSDLWVSDKKLKFSMLGKREKFWLSVIISQNIFCNRGTFVRKTGTH